jgi:hypothetical protein
MAEPTPDNRSRFPIDQNDNCTQQGEPHHECFRNCRIHAASSLFTSVRALLSRIGLADREHCGNHLTRISGEISHMSTKTTSQPLLTPVQMGVWKLSHKPEASDATTDGTRRRSGSHALRRSCRRIYETASRTAQPDGNGSPGLDAPQNPSHTQLNLM